MGCINTEKIAARAQALRVAETVRKARAKANYTAEANRKHRERKQAVVQEAKKQSCADCGNTYPYYVMDLDHTRGEKLFNLSEGYRYSFGKLREEIAKCDVVCANCHRERTHRRSV